MNRDDYRRIKSFSKQEMERWIDIQYNIMYEKLRRKYEQAYKDELDNSVQNFITAIGYTLHFNEDVNLNPDQLASFMDDLFVTVDLFRKGEYKPEDYEKQLKEDGIIIKEYERNKIYKEYVNKMQKQYIPFKERNEKAIKWIDDLISNGPATCNLGDLQQLQNILEGEL